MPTDEHNNIGKQTNKKLLPYLSSKRISSILTTEFNVIRPVFKL